jgi:hypothetical protein
MVVPMEPTNLLFSKNFLSGTIGTRSYEKAY